MKKYIILALIFSALCAQAKVVSTNPDQTAALQAAFAQAEPPQAFPLQVYLTICNSGMNDNCVIQLDPQAPFGNPGVSTRVFDDQAIAVMKVLREISKAEFDGVGLHELTVHSMTCDDSRCDLEIGFSGGAL